ncbi:sulfotransferase [Elysia marginata]|uniref:Sulfotransferase n=1 Tax=Elysia marginata TaxID=1093978 RepID=A0AAV4GI87_9GAST|nr:sulfotransferase [Elysia marginata]
METTADHQHLGEVFRQEPPVTACTSVVSRLCESPKPDGLHYIDMEKVDGVWYMKFDAVDDMAAHLREVRSLRMRHDDVITCGFARSGNHWCFELVNMVLNQTTEFKTDYFSTNLLDIPGNLASIPSPRNLVTHLRPRYFPAEVIKNNTKLIYIIRNPKDVLVSMYHLNSRFSYDSWRFRGSWEEFLKFHLAGDLPMGHWWDHVKTVERFAKAHPNLPVHIFQYEKVRAQPVEEIRKLCHFLGHSDALAEKIALVTRFENMKKKLGKITAVEKLVFSENGVVLRKGEIGDWKNFFSREQSERFDRAFEANTVGSEWAKRVRKYMDLPHAS